MTVSDRHKPRAFRSVPSSGRQGACSGASGSTEALPVETLPSPALSVCLAGRGGHAPLGGGRVHRSRITLQISQVYPVHDITGC